jgi:Domain of unknown function (DUF1707)
MTRRTTLRASDADREQIAERLRQAAAEGRILAEELEERLGAALSARTYGELDAVVADLPAPNTGVSRRPRREVSPIRPVVAVLVALTIAVMLIGVLASAVVGHGHSNHAGFGAGPLIWLVWIAFGWRYISRRRRGTR